MDCSTRLVWWNGRLRCYMKDANMKRFPTKSCTGRHRLPPGQKPRRVQIVHPDTTLCFGNYDKDLERCQICSRAEGVCTYETKKNQRKVDAAP